MFVYSFLLLIFALHVRLKIANLPETEKNISFFSENIQFENVRRFGIPLTLAIVCMVSIISLINAVLIEADKAFSTQNLILGIITMLGVFMVIILVINKNLSRLVKMRTDELVRQKNNLENLVEEKTHELIKFERLSAIGELSGRLAHDLRNPLSVMKMFVDLIDQSPTDTKISDVRVSEKLDLVKKSIDIISH